MPHLRRLLIRPSLSLCCLLAILTSVSSSPSIAQPLPRLRDRVKLAPMDTAGVPPTINPRKLYAQQSAWVDSAMAAMTLQEKVGQLLVAFTFSYYQSDENETYVKLSRLVKEGKLGGIIFSRGDVYEVAMLANRYQSQAKFPLLISADMEWGVSMRINRTTEFPSNMAVAATWNSRYAFEMGRTIGEEARALGIHQNYAPDVDLNNNPKNPIINTRAFSEDISLTNAMAAAFISGTQSAGVIATAKHFPGHGDTELDSHKDLPVLPFTRGRLDSLELQPFSSAIKHGVMSVMIGHLSIPAIDSVENLPATLSQKITTDILKKQLAFAGLVVTDAMMMDGLTKQYSTGDAAVKAVQAGNDVILMSPDYDTAHAAICLAVQRGLISRWRLDNSVRKILLTKEWLGLTKNRYVDLLKVSAKVGTKRNTILAQEIADKSVTMLRNAGNILPLVRRLPKKKLLSISITDSKSCDVGKSFYDSLNTRYNNLLQLRLNADSDEQDYDFALRAAEISEAVVVSCYVTVKSSTGKLGLDDGQNKFLKSLTEKLAEKKIPLVVAAFGSPYVIMGHPKVPAYLCTYSVSKVSEGAVVKILAGEISPQGRLPITIPYAHRFGEGYGFQQNADSKPVIDNEQPMDGVGNP